MKIAVCMEYPIGQHGGTEVLVRELIRGLALRHAIVLVSDDTAETLTAAGMQGHVVEHFAWREGAVTFERSHWLARALKASGAELAHFHFGSNFAWGARHLNLCPAIHLARLGVPCVATNHGVFGLFEGYIGPQRTWLTKLALWPLAWLGKVQVVRHLEAEVAVSQSDWRALRRRYWPVRGKFRQIYHSRIHQSQARLAAKRETVVLCAGTIGPRKGQPYLAAAFAEVASAFPEWKLLFVGRAGNLTTAAELQSWLAKPILQNRAEWRAECSDAELKELLERAEIYAMPSLHEGLGLSLQEALFHGCACIASRIGGIPDLIQDGENGILVGRAKVNELASGLNRLMSDAAFRERLRTRGSASVLEKEMSAEHMIARHEDLYRVLLQR